MARGMGGGGRPSRTQGVPKVGKTKFVPGPGGNSRPPAPRTPQRQQQTQSSPTSTNSTLGSTSSGQYAGYSAGGGGGGGFSAPQTSTPVLPPPTPPTPPPPSIDDYLGADPLYKSQTSALEEALKRFQAEVGGLDASGKWVNGAQGNAYEQDFNRNLNDLGWDSESNSWDQNDKLTSYGSSYGNQIDDFASRGMLESSAYQEAVNNLLRGFTDQKSNMEQGKNTYMGDLLEQFKTAQSDTNTGRDQARTEAIYRRAQEYGL